jgi:hypothetical protein
VPNGLSVSATLHTFSSPGATSYAVSYLHSFGSTEKMEMDVAGTDHQSPEADVTSPKTQGSGKKEPKSEREYVLDLSPLASSCFVYPANMW